MKKNLLTRVVVIAAVTLIGLWVVLGPRHKPALKDFTPAGMNNTLREMVSQLKAGDKIITTGGVIATVTAVREKTLLVRSADKSILEITRASVAAMHGEEEKGS